jgi:hypothetical protein
MITLPVNTDGLPVNEQGELILLPEGTVATISKGNGLECYTDYNEYVQQMEILMNTNPTQ